MKIGIVACTARKNDKKATVEQICSKSPLFKYSVDYCKSNYDETYALSTEHGLLALHEEIESFDIAPYSIQRKEFRSWLEKVAKQIQSKFAKDVEIYFHAGKRLRKVIFYLKEYKCFEPTKGLGIGKQLKFYKEKREIGGGNNV
jgi:hypothetical protein